MYVLKHIYIYGCQIAYLYSRKLQGEQSITIRLSDDID